MAMTAEQYEAVNLRAAAANAARDLRALADSIEGHADSAGGRFPYSEAAGTIVTEVTNALPNLSLSRIIQAAAAADVHRAKGE